jgi:transcriptional regulator with XRE-family HTH domain
MSEPSEALAWRQTRAALRLARHAAGLTPGDVAERLGWPLGLVLCAEQGSRPIGSAHLSALLALYDLDESEKAEP